MPVWELKREPGRRALSLGACILPEAALAFALMPLLRIFPSYSALLSGALSDTLRQKTDLRASFAARRGV